MVREWMMWVISFSERSVSMLMGRKLEGVLHWPQSGKGTDLDGPFSMFVTFVGQWIRSSGLLMLFCCRCKFGSSKLRLTSA